MTQPTPPLRIPDAMGVAEIGPYMRSIREHFKLSQQDVSERLHIRVRYVVAIEDGNFDLMPGKVYARGYIHTYAEFLGLDADQVAERCFPSTPQSAKGQEVFVPKMSLATPTQNKSFWSSLWMPALAGVVLLLIYTQFMGDAEEEAAPAPEQPQQEAVVAAPTPEALLASSYENVMPNARTFDCFEGDDYLSCFFADYLIDDMRDLDKSANSPLAPKIIYVDMHAKPRVVNLRDTSEYERAE